MARCSVRRERPRDGTVRDSPTSGADTWCPVRARRRRTHAPIRHDEQLTAVAATIRNGGTNPEAVMFGRVHYTVRGGHPGAVLVTRCTVWTLLLTGEEAPPSC